MSNGKNIPYRLKMRSPAFCNLSVFSEIAEGWMISDVITILGSLDIVLGEIDQIIKRYLIKMNSAIDGLLSILSVLELPYFVSVIISILITGVIIFFINGNFCYVSSLF